VLHSNLSKIYLMFRFFIFLRARFLASVILEIHIKEKFPITYKYVVQF